MQAPHDNAARKGLRGWWTSPPRAGARRIISPWEYRHLRGWAQVRVASSGVLVGLGVVTLAFGGNDWKTYGWTMAFLAAAAWSGPVSADSRGLAPLAVLLGGRGHGHGFELRWAEVAQCRVSAGRVVGP